MSEAAPFNPALIVDASGRPARRPEDRTCPTCGAPPDRRVLSGGFGSPHDVCGGCGYDFQERTVYDR